MRLLKHHFVSLLIHYLLSMLIVVVVTALLGITRVKLSIQVIALLYLLPVVLSTRLWGLGPGILSALCAFLSFNYFFIPPLYTLAVHGTQDLAALIVFLIIAVVISQLMGHDQESLAAAMAREKEATSLYELSIALAGLQDEQAVAQNLAERICDTFAAEKVDILLQGSTERNPFTCGSSNTTLSSRSDFNFPLSTARGKQGDVRIWRKDLPLSKPEERLLSTFASQGALALERAKLAQNETRARVFEESDRLKSALLSSVSHELRSPLAAIKASISSLRSGAVDWDMDARKELLEATEEETDHLNQLVGNLLDMSRIETGALNPKWEWNSLAEIVGGVVKRMHPVIKQHNIVINIPSNLPLIPVDYVQIEQVFTNLISNSVKYAPAGTDVSISAHIQADRTVLVKVSNQGPPVAEEHLERIFDKFYRVTAADKVTGTGLGLSICKGIVDAHGGRIWAENGPNSFIFYFTLPSSRGGILPHYPEET
jgi:two-component system, OmpR family, sensor histidine kinase KdpD